MSNLIYAELELPLVYEEEEPKEEKKEVTVMVLDISPDNENEIKI